MMKLILLSVEIMKYLEQFIFYQEEIKITQYLSETGVGKTALAEGLALKISKREVPILLSVQLYILLIWVDFWQELDLEEILKND